MKFLIIFGLVLFVILFIGASDDLAYGQFSNTSTLKVSFENNLLPSYEVPLVSGQTFTLSQNHSWVQDETSRYNLVSYTLDGEAVKISRIARGDFTLSIPTDSSHNIVFSAVQQHALSVDGTNDFSFLPSSPTNDNWFDAGTPVSVNVQKTTEIEANKVRQEITGWSLDKAEFWEIENNDSTSFTTPPIILDEYHQVDFFTAYQYKLNVISDAGETTGSDWYEQGVTVPIGINAGGDGLVLNSVSGWEGADVTYDGNIAQVFIDGPVTVSAKVEKNYSLVVGVIVVPILIIGVIGYRKFKSRIPVVEEKPVERIVEKVIERVETPEKKYGDGYDKKLSDYLSEQIQSKLDEMKSSGILSDSKYSKIAESY
mgnify:CR=1 FL=1|jgi:hypothetical protein